MKDWIDGAVYVLARKHGLQFDYVRKWLISHSITSDKIEGYYKMSSGDFLDVLFAV